MATITVFQNLTLDGVMQAPGTKDEDRRNGFAHGGWAADKVVEDSAGFAGGGPSGGGLLFGHRTYDSVLHAWTTTPEPNPFTQVLVRTPKYVVSRSVDTPLAYPESTLLAGEAAETVAALKDRLDGTLTILGSGELIRSLQDTDLIDDYVLLIHPIVLGSGQRMFGPGCRQDLTLRESRAAASGVIIAHYSTR